MTSLLQALRPSHLLALPSRLYVNTQPQGYPEAVFCNVNTALADTLGLDLATFHDTETLSLLGGASIPVHLSPLATVYAGHQFGIYTSRLGDGRVHILGDVLGQDGNYWELQLKGAGATPFSRGNSGRMSLPEAISEYLACEAMAGLGIATTRGLSLVQATQYDRDDLAELILVRLAPSHVRFGHFEYLHNQFDQSLLKALSDQIILQFFPELIQIAEQERYLHFLFIVTQRTAQLVAQWQAVGFVHGVMNTDNMSILGLTMDYGVYGFMPAYQTSYSPNPSDDQNRYAFDQQMDVARWNCLALAEAMTSLLPGKRVPSSLLRHYRQVYDETWLNLMRKKLGLFIADTDDHLLIKELLQCLQRHQIDYTRFFRQLAYFPHRMKQVASDVFAQSVKVCHLWFDAYRKRLQRESCTQQTRVSLMLNTNPKYVLRHEHLSTVCDRAKQLRDFSGVQELMTVLQSPFYEHPEYECYA